MTDTTYAGTDPGQHCGATVDGGEQMGQCEKRLLAEVQSRGWAQGDRQWRDRRQRPELVDQEMRPCREFPSRFFTCFFHEQETFATPST